MGPIGGTKITIISQAILGRFWMLDWSVLITSKTQ
jgi:hypothetical protein